jgi:hypothetical protein
MRSVCRAQAATSLDRPLANYGQRQMTGEKQIDGLYQIDDAWPCTNLSAEALLEVRNTLAAC